MDGRARSPANSPACRRTTTRHSFRLLRNRRWWPMSRKHSPPAMLCHSSWSSPSPMVVRSDRRICRLRSNSCRPFRHSRSRAVTMSAVTSNRFRSSSFRHRTGQPHSRTFRLRALRPVRVWKPGAWSLPESPRPFVMRQHRCRTCRSMSLVRVASWPISSQSSGPSIRSCSSRPHSSSPSS